MSLDPQAKTVIDAIQSTGLTDISEMDVDAIRTWMRAFTFPSDVSLHAIENRTVPGPAGPIPVRVYRPSEETDRPVLVFLHGGGWVIGDLDTHDPICRVLARDVGCVVVSVDYRLAPEAAFPAAVEDAYAACRWVREHASEVGGDPARVAIGGDSAGGNLSAVVAQLSRDDGAPKLVFQLLVYPVTDYRCDRPSMTDNATGYFLTRAAVDWFYDNYLPRPGDGDDPRVSPLRTSDLTGLPPALVITAGYDPLRDQGAAYADALRGAGNEVRYENFEGLFHGFFGMQAIIEAAGPALNDAVAALRRAFGEEE